MTSTINNTTAIATVNEDGTITLTTGDQTLNLSVTSVTSVVTALLAARKGSYELARKAQAAKKAEAKAERSKKAAERKAASAKKAAERVAKLKAQLAEAEKKAA